MRSKRRKTTPYRHRPPPTLRLFLPPRRRPPRRRTSRPAPLPSTATDRRSARARQQYAFPTTPCQRPSGPVISARLVQSLSGRDSAPRSAPLGPGPEAVIEPFRPLALRTRPEAPVAPSLCVRAHMNVTEPQSAQPRPAPALAVRAGRPARQCPRDRSGPTRSRSRLDLRLGCGRIFGLCSRQGQAKGYWPGPGPAAWTRGVGVGSAGAGRGGDTKQNPRRGAAEGRSAPCGGGRGGGGAA